jgi:hypothetical protein
VTILVVIAKKKVKEEVERCYDVPSVEWGRAKGWNDKRGILIKTLLLFSHVSIGKITDGVGRFFTYCIGPSIKLFQFNGVELRLAGDRVSGVNGAHRPVR